MRPRQRRRDNRPNHRPGDRPGNSLGMRSGQGTFRGLESFRLRILAVFGFVFLGFGLIGVSLLSVALIPAEEPKNTYQAATSEPQPIRGQIVDAQGQVMAASLKVKSLFADPHNVMDVDQVVRKLPEVLPSLSPEALRHDLQKNRRFVWIKRHLTPSQVFAVNNLGLPGLGFRQEMQRVYPQEQTAAHVLGSVNYRGEGVFGVEKGKQQELAQGDDVRLTLDMRLQHALRESLLKAVKISQAKAAWGVSLDAKTGHIKAMVSLPDYDANHFGAAPKKVWLNRALDGVYEMGSVFKLFTHATAIEHNNMKMTRLIDCTRPLEIGDFTIHDFVDRNAWLTAEDVFVHSSNVGAAQIGEMVGGVQQQNTLAKLGFFNQFESGLGSNAATLAPPPYKWGRIQTMSVSYGHGIAVTPLQMAAAARAVLVDGIWRQPLVERNSKSMPPQKVFSPKTVGMMRKLAGAVVARGTGRKADVPGYSIGGKTGTSEKNIAGKYVGDKNLASFVGVAPLNNPEILTFIMVDEPTEGGGGAVAAPAFKAYNQKALALLNVPPENKLSAVPVVAPELREAVSQHAVNGSQKVPQLKNHAFALAYSNQ